MCRVILAACFCVACALGAQDQVGRMDSTSGLNDGARVESNAVSLEDRVEIIDYKRGKILGFMIVRNGNIIRRVLFKEPILLGQPEQASTQPSPAEQPKPAQEPSQANAPTLPKPLESKQATPKPKATQPKASDTDVQATQATQTIYERQVSNAPKDTKSPTKRAPKASSGIAQEVGVESTRINPTYKNRQWDKKHIIHDISTEEVIEIER